jgi:leucyl aminopeptidase (aminopeptidase T)
MKQSLHSVSETVWKDCIKVKSREKGLVITDGTNPDIADSLAGVGMGMCDCEMIKIPVANINGEDPPEWASEKMLGVDIIIAPTRFSITHTKSTKQAAEKGARIITMPNILMDTYLRAIPIDYTKVNEYGENLKKNFGGNEFRVETKAGTDLTLFRENREVFNSHGMIEPGMILNLPTGEVGFAPMENKTEGILMVDGSCAPDSKTKFGSIGLVKKPFKVLINKGEAIDCENDVLWNWITSSTNGSNVAEFAVGTNPSATIIGNILEDEKVLETSHVAFGTNINNGGTVRSDIHLDAVFRNPKISVDEKMIIKEGKFLF